MKPPDSGSIKRTSHEGESRDTITVTFYNIGPSSYYKPSFDRVLQTYLKQIYTGIVRKL
jgi:hypothetical protein